MWQNIILIRIYGWQLGIMCMTSPNTAPSILEDQQFFRTKQEERQQQPLIKQATRKMQETKQCQSIEQERLTRNLPWSNGKRSQCHHPQTYCSQQGQLQWYQRQFTSQQLDFAYLILNICYQNRKLLLLLYFINSQMTDQIHTEREWYDISEAQFGFLYPQEIRKLSCCQIINLQVYNSNKLPMKQGLYDPALGVSPNDRQTTCVTCGHVGMRCSGHPGHIELLLPVYNPMIIDILLKLLRMNCFHCHRFRIKNSIKEDFQVILTLVKHGLINQAKTFWESDTISLQRKIKKEQLQKKKQNDKEKSTNKQKIEIYEKKVKEIESLKQKFTELARKKSLQSSNNPTSASIENFNIFIKKFYSLVQNKCPYCKTLAKTVKKEGANKIFVITSSKEQANQRKKSRDSTSKAESGHHTNDMTEQASSQKKKRQKFFTQKEIYKQLKQLWTNEQKIVQIIFGNDNMTNSFAMFFLRAVFVPPSRFRPESKMGDQKYLHDQTTMLTKILQMNEDLRAMVITQRLNQIVQKQGSSNRKAKYTELRNMKTTDMRKAEWIYQVQKKLRSKQQFINKWLELQDSVNCYMDSTKSSRISDKDFKGVRQVLEKKEGLFRMKMMGKRVNYAARSVISPDPSLNTDEVGLPLFMAKKLTFAEPVNEYNLQKLQSYVINGKNYPGANYIIENGKFLRLELLSDQQRLSLARNLMINHENKTVYRHLIDGDNVMFNRQPTLHKPGLMAHRIKVLPKQSTLRMNYANCKSYNADFDGDEMNLHALQNYMAKAEAELCISDKMYNSPLNGKPIREIIQDGIIAAVYLTMRDTFFNKKDFSELLYQATFALFEKKPRNTRLFVVKPAILKPKQMWTGKQLITNVIKIVVSLSDLKFKQKKGLCMRSTTKVPKSYMSGYQEQSTVIVIDNQLLLGIIDKNQVGSGSDFGLIDSFNQLYGEALTGKLMTCLTKLFLAYIQVHGFTCGMDDLILKSKVNKTRINMVEQTHQQTVSQICKHFICKQPTNVNYFGRSRFKCDENGQFVEDQTRIHVKQTQQILHYIQRKIVSEENATEELDAQYKHHIYDKSSKVVDACMKGFMKMFPHNNFSMMTITGAKGSNVNHSQVSVMLGQQELQGRRVPLMISGKTLPSYLAYDPNPRASGFISDRFLTGLRLQDFYFHCMAGRQGLIDTAVKTSRSGYLQRCLMKHLQTLKVEYDYTVRDCDGSIVQFFYGQDSLDPAKNKFFSKLDFLKDNFDAFKAKYKHSQNVGQFKLKQIQKFKKQQESAKSTIMQVFPPARNLGSMSEKCFQLVKNNANKQFKQVYALKYAYTMIQPGECVGCTGAQSIGQPSTQMTLNTFHLAGHGGVNLTLGIPRLRQLLLTSSAKIKTPIMELHFKEKVNKQQALNFARHLQKIKLSQLIKDLQVQQWKQLYSHQKLLGHSQRKRYYKILINYEQQKHIVTQFNITHKEINEKIKQTVIPLLLNHINRVKKRNQLRAEIKRLNVSDKPQEEEEQKQENQQMEEKEKQKPENEQKQMKAEGSQKQDLQFSSPEYESSKFVHRGCEIVVKVPLNLKKFLMTKVVEKILKSTIVRQIAGIQSAIVLQKKGAHFIQTEGVNFNILKDLDFINLNTVGSNDINAISLKFGIQAARNGMIREIVTLFGAYGVTVDYRHLYLIGDYVTFGGNIKAMNRNWMSYSASPFLRMSYETSVKFITNSALHCQIDKCISPSSSIILGQAPKLGTGMCDLLMDTGL